MVDYIFPEIIEWEKVKNILEDHKIGEIFSIEVDWKFLSYDLKNKIQSWKTDIHQGGGALSFYFSPISMGDVALPNSLKNRVLRRRSRGYKWILKFNAFFQ